MSSSSSQPAPTNTNKTISNCSQTHVEQEKCYDPKDPNLKFVDREDEMDVFSVGYKSARALMSCGHSATPMSLTSYCRRILEEGRSKLVCAVCDEHWTLREVQKMALLTPNEVDNFEKMMWENYKVDNSVKKCPGCKSLVLRTDLNNLCVECAVCSAGRVGHFLFCWQCLKEWRGTAPRAGCCENKGCDMPLDILRKCPYVKFKNPALAEITECPRVRACPTCGLLVEHDTNGCKCITCERCNVLFCFVCLKTEKKCSETSSPFDYCSDSVAPRQTAIPARPNI